MIVLDIECVKTDNENFLKYKVGNISAPSTYKDPEKIEKYIAEGQKKAYSKAALSPLTGKIILIGMLISTTEEEVENQAITKTEIGNVLVNFYEVNDTFNEPDMLSLFWADLANLWDNGNAPLVTYNGKSFDVPYLIQRSIINGITLPPHLPTMDELLYKYNNRHHVDLFHTLNPNHGNYSSLNEWSFLTGDSNILESNQASDIAEWYEKGEFDKIKQKNTEDLFKSYFLYNKVKQWI